MLVKFGENLGEFRKAAGLTQEELAAQAGISSTHIEEIERGERNLSLGTLHKVAKALGIDVAKLVSFAETEVIDFECMELIRRIVRNADSKALHKVLMVLRIAYNFEEGRVSLKDLSALVPQYAGEAR